MKKYLILLLSFGFALSCFSQKTKKNDKNEDKNSKMQIRDFNSRVYIYII